MPRTRLTLPLVICCLLAVALAWAWVERDRLATAVASWLAGDTRINHIEGLQLSPATLAIDQVSLTLSGGTPVELRGITVSHPWQLWRGAARSEIAVESMRLGNAPRSAAPRNLAENIRLSDLLAIVRRALPLSLDVRHLVPAGAPDHPLRIQLDRTGDDQRVRLRITGEGVTGQLVMANLDPGRPQTTPLQLEVSLGDTQGSRAVALSGTLAPDPSPTLTDTTPTQWRTELTLAIDLESLERAITALSLPVPLTQKLGPAYLALASGDPRGEMQARLSGNIPDNLVALEQYGNILVLIDTIEVTARLDRMQKPLPLAMALATEEPIRLDITTLQPLQVKQAAGSANVRLTPIGDSGDELLSGNLQAHSTAGASQLSASGSLDLTTATSLLGATDHDLITRLQEMGIRQLRGQLPFEASATLPPVGQVAGAGGITNLHLQLQPDSQPAAEISRTDTTPESLQQVFTALAMERGVISLNLAKAVSFSADHWPGPMAVNGEAVSMALTDGSGTRRFSATAESLACQLDTATHCTLSLVAEAPEIHLPGEDGGSIKDSRFSVQGALSLENGRGKLDSSQLQLNAGALQAGEVEAENATVKSGKFSCMRDSQQVFRCSGALLVTLPWLRAGKMEGGGSLALKQLDFVYQPDKLQLSSDYSTDDWSAKFNDQYQVFSEARGHFSLRDRVLRGDTRARLGHVAANGEWMHNLASDGGSATLSLPDAEFSKNRPLSNVVSGLPVELVSGQMVVQGRLSWPAGDSDTLSAQLSDIAAVYDKSFAVGITGNIALQREDGQWATPEPQDIAVESIDVGVPIENVRFALSLEADNDLVLNGFNAELLEGNVQSDSITWNLDGKARRSQVSITGLSLKALSNEMEAGNFAASGVLDTTIPLVTDAGGITVERGTVKARPPGGRLRYYGAFSPEMLSSNPQLKMLAGALEDYDYRSLSGTLEYPPSGDMQMQLKLVGRSASVDKDRDLIINLNLENNIPAMLRSLQASRDLADALEKQIGAN
ncbi:intermembrane phospholipid transport protein YdbH family protein [Microbulbifer sp. YPW16]|uniref:intermembrane phospholipid transport protein YdbH family protein n=1 Tax=Microbulbifer sp. YPW16 TaxID=2904242 RepID=UPI001E57B177|nr:YdbH domain-containing protein [Microbulbifer sp. YPW16]UHQ56151.1 YdbH domain-containing protein [Microbulbifer sp. YPW16]